MDLEERLSEMTTDDTTSPTYEQPPLDEGRIRQRAWEISQSDEAGTPEENWQRAEQELRQGIHYPKPREEWSQQMAAPHDVEIVRIWSYRVDIDDPGDIGGYSIHAVDGDIGKVDRHDGEAGRAHLLVATGPWIFGKTVMLPAGVIDRVDHEDRTVYVNVTKDQIKNAPEYEEDRAHDQGYRDQLSDYYGGA